jgi:neutral ceramidase
MKSTELHEELLCGVAIQEITPQSPISMGGYGQRAGLLSTGIHDPLFTKALFLKRGKNRLCIITADLISIPDAVFNRVLTSLVNEGTIDEKGLCISASHTHSGPDVEESLIIASPTREFLEGLVEKMVLAAKEAAGKLQPVGVRISTGQADFLKNRRSDIPDPLVDRRVFAVEFDHKETHRPLAILFGVGCHAVCLGHDNLQISADYPGAAQTYLEKHVGVESALFVNMAEGNVIPSTRPKYDSLDTRGYMGGTFEDSRTVGESLGREVIEALRESQTLDNPTLQSARRVISVKPSHAEMGAWSAWKNLLKERRIILEYLPGFRKATPFNLKPVYTLWRDASQVVIERNMDESEMRRLMSAVSRFLIMAMKLGNPSFRKPYSLAIQVIRLGDLRILTLPGEVLVEVGQEWQARNAPFGKQAFIFGLSNGFVGYLPHPDNFKEPEANFKYETIMNALEQNATVLALTAATEMIQ